MNWKITVASFFLIACNAGVPPRTAPSADYAALPDSVSLPAGWVRVQVVDSLWIPDRPGVTVLGRFNALDRTIYINKQIRSPQQRWKTLFHELAHVTLLDAGLQNVLYSSLDPAFIEMLADAFATQRMAELSRIPK